MLAHHQAADPAVHELAIKIARRAVAIIGPPPRQEEIHEAPREFYLATREELEAVREGMRIPSG
ncbi:MAG: hypothetical protein AB7I30_01280 [Isosphaeraceae bacterium]